MLSSLLKFNNCSRLAIDFNSPSFHLQLAFAGTPDVSVKTEMEVCPLEVTDKDVRLSDVTLPGCRVSDDGVPISEIPDLRMPDDRILDVRIPDVRVSDTMLSDDRVPDVRVIDMSDMVAVLPDYTVANRYSPVSGHAPNHTPKHVLKPVSNF